MNLKWKTLYNEIDVPSKKPVLFETEGYRRISFDVNLISDDLHVNTWQNGLSHSSKNSRIFKIVIFDI